MIEQNLPALIVVVPLLAGLFCALSGRGMVAWVIAFTSTILSFAVAVKLLAEVHAYGVISYAMGNWTIPFGIEYRIDGLNALVLLLVSGIAVVVTFYARVSLQKEIPADRLHFFYAVWMLCITGLLGITVTGDAFNVYVLLEISSLTTYTLVAMGKGRDKRALTASINYLVLGTIGASFILLGIGYLYMATGTLNMADMAERLRGLEDNRTVITAFALLMVGFSVKMALFPLHAWLPNAYTYAPSAATALLAATATKVGVYTALRFLFTILGVEFSFRGAIPTGTIVMVFGSLAILFASYVAIRQTNIKRMLAYSSVAQIGYIALGFALANQAGLTGSLVHVFNHAIMKGGLFLALGAVAYSTNSTDIASMRGLGRKMPITMAAFVAGGFGLIGVPLTSGFVSKWYLVSGAIGSGHLELAVVILVGSLLALIYIWKVIESAYFKSADEDAPNVKEAPWSLLVPTWVLIGASLYFGINAKLTSRIAIEAAQALLGGGA